MSAARTPGPWRVDTWNYPDRGRVAVIQNANEAVCEMYKVWRPRENPIDPTCPEATEANAAFIVEACNAYDEAVDLLEYVAGASADPNTTKSELQSEIQARVFPFLRARLNRKACE